MGSAAQAGLAYRAIAKITDIVLIGWFAGYLASACTVWTIGPDAWDATRNSSTTVSFTFLFFLIVFDPLLFLALQTAFLSSWGATPGKLLWGLEVVTVEGTPPGLWRNLGRTLAEFPSAIALGVGYLSAVVTASRQTWHDRMSTTRVIQATVNRPGRWATVRSRRGLGAALAALIVLSGPGIGWLAPRVHSRIQPAADRYIWAGLRAYSERDYPEALDNYTRAIAADPRSSLAYANRGSVYGDMGDLEHQIADCTKALELDSTQVWALLGRGRAYLTQGDLTASSANYSRVIQLRPDWSGLVFAFRGRGSNLFRLGRYDDAAADFGAGARIGMEQYLGTSDFEKNTQFMSAIWMCDLFRSEALRRAGHVSAADSVWANSRIRRAGDYFGGEQAMTASKREWLGE